VAHDGDRLGAASRALEDAQTVDEAFNAVNGLGAPGQNFVVADEGGHIGWTPVRRDSAASGPERPAADIMGTTDRADGADRSRPRSIRGCRDPRDGRIWTANARCRERRNASRAR
jgi:penicillin amidase